ncbi:MAG: S-methyl-5-thioribose-1-phosphate isomerase [Candidatus Bathyarchaeia archaeon]
METIRWQNGVIIAIDQTKLPHRLTRLRLKSPKEVADAIREMKIRGAPLLGAAAALALAQAAYRSKAKNKKQLLQDLEEAAELIKSTRPTAVNLFHGVKVILDYARGLDGEDLSEVVRSIIDRCLRLLDEDAEVNMRLSKIGAALLSEKETVLTHCNAGAFATVQHGTALGVIIQAHREGKRVEVIATETRPLLQGARLTAYELSSEGVPVRIIPDSAAGLVMQRGMVGKVILGADRILATGHVINKVGTYMLAVLARENRVPFFVVAPTSTIDPASRVDEVIIEERPPEEILEFSGKRIAPKGVGAFNPAFDITPPKFVSAIVTEKGVSYPPFDELRVWVKA